jgi:hypothetical protein
MEQRPAHYGLALIGIIAVIFASAGADEGGWLAFAALTVQGAVLVFVLHTSDVGLRTRRIGEAVALVAVVGGLLSLAEVGPGTERTAAMVSTLMVLATPVAIIQRVGRQATVDATVIAGAICIYLLLGLFFARIYGLEDQLSQGPFFVQAEQASDADHVYFSFVTLATLGYGDLTPVGDLGRMTAVTEALLGQIYLVTVVALAVSRIGSARRRRTAEEP